MFNEYHLAQCPGNLTTKMEVDDSRASGSATIERFQDVMKRIMAEEFMGS